MRPTAAPAAFPYQHRTVAEVTAAGKRRPQALRPVPADFTAYAPGKSVNHLAEHYCAGEATIKRWRQETGVRAYDPARDGPITRAAPMPEDFADRAPHHSDRELGRHYGRDYKTIVRWRREAGIERKAPVKPNRSFVRAVKGRVVLPGRSLHRAPLLTGREDDAAQHLRRFYPSIYRCAETGRADQKGRFWRCGNAVLEPAELIERAERRGWNPDAWMEVAA